MKKCKICSTCKIEKSTTQFHFNKGSPDGFHSKCLSCNNKLTIFRKYGIDFDEELKKQDNKCASCGDIFTIEGNSQPRVDHDHGANEYRGIICNGCNVIIGMSDENIQVLESAIKYLKIHENNDEKSLKNMLLESMKY